MLNRVAEVLRNQIAPLLGIDSSELEVISVDDGIASVRLTGVCASCPASLPTLIATIERELQTQVPGIDILELVP
jgi:Fe-S cluster biogenesis protein NfuA